MFSFIYFANAAVFSIILCHDGFCILHNAGENHTLHKNIFFQLLYIHINPGILLQNITKIENVASSLTTFFLTFCIMHVNFSQYPEKKTKSLQKWETDVIMSKTEKFLAKRNVSTKRCHCIHVHSHVWHAEE